jgi:hypothetical protein
LRGSRAVEQQRRATKLRRSPYREGVDAAQ